MKARVHVMLKQGVLDPQGEAVRHALGSLGFDGVEGVRQISFTSSVVKEVSDQSEFDGLLDGSISGSATSEVTEPDL